MGWGEYSDKETIDQSFQAIRKGYLGVGAEDVLFASTLGDKTYLLKVKKIGHHGRPDLATDSRMAYEIKYTNGKAFDYPLGKIVCVGRNYAEHARELNNPVPTEPILFIKPESSAVSLKEPLAIPHGDCHYETELSILIGETLTKASATQVREAIAGVGLALDLTKRALQGRLKEKSHPWEIAKSFDGACPLSEFVPMSNISTLDELTFSMRLNGELKQEGDVKDMITPIIPLLEFITQHFTLKPGDVVLTGTPKGVGQLHAGDEIAMNLLDQYSFQANIA